MTPAFLECATFRKQGKKPVLAIDADVTKVGYIIALCCPIERVLSHAVTALTRTTVYIVVDIRKFC